MREKLDKNGARLFCDQKGYLGCYNIQYAQCMDELSPLKGECLAKANEKFPVLASADEAGLYTEYFSQCLAIKHMKLHANDDVRKIGDCMKNLRVDPEDSAKSLTQ